MYLLICSIIIYVFKVFFQSSVSLQDEQAQIAQIELAAKKELEGKKGQKKKPEKRQDRKSKNAAMQEIYSESNRQFRESGSKLNYHRPKQRTLEEFLNRKKRTGKSFSESLFLASNNPQYSFN